MMTLQDRTTSVNHDTIQAARVFAGAQLTRNAQLNDRGGFARVNGRESQIGKIKAGWGTWIRTKIDGVRVRSSTVELFPKGRGGAVVTPGREAVRAFGAACSDIRAGDQHLRGALEPGSK